MPTLPQEIFEPSSGTRREVDRWRLNDPSDGDGDPAALVSSGTVRQNELDQDDQIPAGQELERIEYEVCQFSSGSEEVVGTSGPCTIYKILYTCTTFTEIWWLRIPPVRVSHTTSSKWCVWKAVVVCPDGTWAVAPREIWKETGPYDAGQDSQAGEAPAGVKPPSVYLPPRELPIIVQSGQGYRDGDFLIEKDNFWELVPPYSITGCWYTAWYKMRTRIRRTNVTSNVATVRFEDFVPETKEMRTERIPGCVDEVKRDG